MLDKKSLDKVLFQLKFKLEFFKINLLLPEELIHIFKLMWLEK